MLLPDNTSNIDNNDLSCVTPPPTYHPSPLTQHIFQQQQQPSSQQQRQRMRSASSSTSYNLTTPPLHSSGIRKKRSITAASRQRSISTSYGDRLHHLALEQSVEADFQALQQHYQQQQQQSSLNWLTPQHSPEPSHFFQREPVALEQFQWAAPTPPRSECGIPSVSADFVDDCQQPEAADSPHIFAFDQSTATVDMRDMNSSLGFLLPSQYANGEYSSAEDTPSSTQPTTSAPASAPQYGQTISSSPSLYQSRPVAARRQSDLPTPGLPPPHRLTGSYDSPSNGDYAFSQPQNIPPIGSMPLGSPMTSPAPAAPSMAPHYGHVSGSPAMYDSSQYYAGPSTYSSAPGPSQMYAPAPGPAYPPSTYTGPLEGEAGPAYPRPAYPPRTYSGTSMDTGEAPVYTPSHSSNSSIDSSRQQANGPKRSLPQCWDHGCNGRQFSTFSNLLRHQREKSGTAAKSSCPKCGAEFTRTTARNGHMAHDKCTKARRPSDEGPHRQ